MELRYRGRTLSTAQPGQRPQPSLPSGTDLLPQIKHIVVLMMENHSYDNYLGMLTGRGEGFPLDGDGQPAVTNLDAEGSPVPAHHLATTQQAEGAPCQSWHASQVQWNQGKMDGFVTSTQEVTPDADKAVGMGYWTQDDLPFYYGLARSFPLADHWFSAARGRPSPTAASSSPARPTAWSTTSRSICSTTRANGTIFDMLTRHGISWANYHPVAGDKSRVAAGGSLPAPPGPPDADRPGPGPGARSPMGCRRISSSPPTCSRSASASTCCTSTALTSSSPMPTPACCPRSAWWTAFDEFSEENPQDIGKGESFAAEVINRVMHGKGWPDTLLIWTYDEHGGYYDHVPPPRGGPAGRRDGRS